MPHKGIHSRGYLPHWDFEKSLQGITFRLADAVPAMVIQGWRAELHSSPGSADEAATELCRKIAKYEDAGHGCCLLANPGHARIVRDALLEKDGIDYKLIDWCVMPNHVHVLVKLLGDVSLGAVVKRWKAASAIEINRLTGRTGSLWMRDYHDRLIRDEEHFHNARIYIRNNPVKAGLCGEPERWEWSSAGQGWGDAVGNEEKLAK